MRLRDDVKAVLERIKKPIVFASRDDFAHLDSLTGIEIFMKKQLEELRKVSDGDKQVGDLEELFERFDSLSREQKKDRITKASALIAAFNNAVTIGSSESSRAHPTVSSADTVAAPAAKLDTPIQYCKGIGPKRAQLLKKLGIATIEDALSYLPWRYEDRGNLKKIGKVSIGSYETVMGNVISADIVRTQRRWVKVFELVITDKSGILVGSWFNQPFMQKSFKTGQTVILSGNRQVESVPWRPSADR